MADPRSIHEFTTGQVEATTLLLGDFVDLDAQSGYTTLKMSVSDLGEVLLEDIEYTQDLQTVDKTIIGAINENKSVIGYSYDAYDDTTTSANPYSVGDLVIYNNALYKCIAPTYGAWDATKWELTSIADEIGRIDTELSDLTPEIITANPNTQLTGLTDVYQSIIRVGKILYISLSFNASNIPAWTRLFDFTDISGNFGNGTYGFLITNRSGIYLNTSNDGVTGKLSISSAQAINQSIAVNGIVILA